MGASKTGELRSSAEPLYKVSLLFHNQDSEEQEKKENHLLVENVPSCIAFKDALDNIALGVMKINPFSGPNYILRQDPQVLCAQEACKAPLVLFVNRDVRHHNIIRFLAQAELTYFKYNDQSLQRRHEALFHAVCREDDAIVSILVQNGAPVTGTYDLILQLVKNCHERVQTQHRSARDSCYTCLGPTQTVASEDSAHKIAKLLIQHKGSVASAAKAAWSTTCAGICCTLLRIHHMPLKDLGDKKLREKNGAQKSLSPARPPMRRSSPPPSSSYVTIEDEDEIEIRKRFASLDCENEDEIR